MQSISNCIKHRETLLLSMTCYSVWSGGRRNNIIYFVFYIDVVKQGAQCNMPKSFLTHFVSGYYVYTEVTNRTSFFADAHLVSPFFRQAGKTCKFQFWYHMFGPNIGYLQVYYRRNSRDKRLFNIFGNQGNQWKKGIVDIPKCANDFQVSGFRLFNKTSVAITDLGCSFDRHSFQCNSIDLTNQHYSHYRLSLWQNIILVELLAI